MAIIAKSPQELQENLDNLHEYCEKWGLQVNEAKTKIMVFRKRGKLKGDERWYYNGTLLDLTDDFNYLGCIFHYTGTFDSHVEHVVGKSLKNLNSLLHKCRKIPVSLKTQCQLFDSFVGSTLCYGSEICGYSKSKEVERVHLKFLKRILGVKSSTCSAAVYGDLGRYPMYIARYCRLITYWCKLVSSDNIILRTVYNQAVTDSNNDFKNWVSNIKNLLNDYGFSDVFNKGIYDPLYLKQFPKVFKQRVIDCFIQDWLSTVHNSAALKDYSLIKHTFGYEPYLDVLSRDMRIYFTRLRFSTLSLRIETGRYSNPPVPRSERLCPCCNAIDIEDSYHFLFLCSCYNEIRHNFFSFLPVYFRNRPSVFKFTELLKSQDKNIIKKTAVYVKHAIAKRLEIL